MKIYNFLILFFSIAYIESSYAYSSCAYYKTGKFILFDQKAGIHTRIDRTESEQVETDLKTGLFLRFKIRWISECEYELLFVEGNSDQSSFFKNRILTVRITDVYADGFKFEGKLEGSTKVISNILRVL